MSNRPDKSEPEERDRHRKALELKLQGLTYADIARELGYADKSGAYYAVASLLERVESEGAAELRQLEDARLDALHATYWPAALEGDVKAAEIIGRTHDRRVKLHGLAVPERLIVAQAEVLDHGEFAVEATRLMRELGYVKTPPAALPAAEPGDTEPWSNI